MSALSAYIQQSTIEPLSIRHEFYMLKIQQLTDVLISIFATLTPEQRAMNLSSLDGAIQSLTTYTAQLDQLQKNISQQSKDIQEQIILVRDYSMVDSLVREQMEDLVKQQNALARDHQSVLQIRSQASEVLERLRSLLTPDEQRVHHQQKLKEIEQRGRPHHSLFHSPSSVV